MSKIVNYILTGLRFILLIVSFMVSLYIIISMYNRLNKDLITSINTLLPFILLIIIYIINIVFKHKSINENIVYNVVSILVFIMILFICFRTFNDTNMLMNIKLGYKMNFNYFADALAPIKSLLFLLVASDILLIVSDSNVESK